MEHQLFAGDARDTAGSKYIKEEKTYINVQIN